MSNLHVIVGFAKVGTQLFADIDGAVLSARAADADGHIAAVVLLEAGQPVFQVADDIPHHFSGFFMALQKLDDRQVSSGKPAEVLIPVGVGQAADIKHHVRIHGDAMLEAKGLKQKGDFLRSEEHTSELQSRENLVCRLLLEKKK